MPEEKEEVLTDEEVCKMLRISPVTMRRHLAEGPGRKRHGCATGDIRTIRHFTVGGARRWVKSSVDEFIHGVADA
jgi:predicted DNA-binding transcriptional regulator AlpA